MIRVKLEIQAVEHLSLKLLNITLPYCCANAVDDRDDMTPRHS